VLGEMSPDHRGGVNQGWSHILSSIKKRARR
jgi:hypothetical protein